MATTIEQEPLYTQMPVGQDVIFTIANPTIVAAQIRVKFIAEVYISSTTVADYSLIGTFKTTPNNAGVGMFDFRPVVENYVKADNMAANGSEYKGTTTDDDTPHALQLIDKFSTNDNSVRYLQVVFTTEYFDTTNNVMTTDGTAATSTDYTLVNGYLKYTDILNIFDGQFGYSLSNFNPTAAISATKKFLTNAPATQYANVDDYGTVSFLTPTVGVANDVDSITFTYYDSAGSSIGTPDVVYRTTANGAYDVWTGDASNEMIHFGCFPANLQNWSSTFQGLVSAGTIQGGHYIIQAKGAAPASWSSVQAYTIYVNCADLRNYESIRISWLNQWGAWDYYTFTKKSTRSMATNGTTYEQLAGTWNESKYRIDSFKGGKKAFRVNSTEKIRMNSDYVGEEFNTMFEELINSPEVYLLDSFQTDGTYSSFNQYITPVRLTTSSFTRKTIANDKLIQYTFEIEKSKTLRTQSV